MNLEVINILSFYHSSKIQFHVSENETLNPLRAPFLTFALFSPGTGLMWCLQPQMEGSLFKVP
jgi:hypothetical protein